MSACYEMKNVFNIELGPMITKVPLVGYFVEVSSCIHDLAFMIDVAATGGTTRGSRYTDVDISCEMTDGSHVCITTLPKTHQLLVDLLNRQRSWRNDEGCGIL